MSAMLMDVCFRSQEASERTFPMPHPDKSNHSNLILATLCLLGGAALFSTTSVAHGGVQWLRRGPTQVQHRAIRFAHSRSVQCDISSRSRCYHTRGDLDLHSQNVRWFPWASVKPIKYAISTRITAHADRVVLTVDYRSYEWGGDHSWFNKRVEHVVYRAPSGYRIDSASGPRGGQSWYKYGAHAGQTLLSPSWFARGIGCSSALIYGDQHGNDLYQGYRLRFPLTMNLKPS